MDKVRKTVLITGGTKGVGAEVARFFAKKGENLVLVARSQAGLDDMKRELQNQCELITVIADISDPAALSNIVNKAVAHFGCIDILVNNAGCHHRGEFSRLSAQQVAEMTQANFTAPLVLTRLCLPYLTRSKSAAVIMVASLAGMAPLQGAATYSATKAGLRAFSYALADELTQSNIKVGVVSPGPINTGFIMDNIDVVEDIVYSQPMSTAEDVAENIAKLCQPSSKTEIAMPYVSGKLATLGYLFPLFRKLSRPLLYRAGKKNKQKYRAH
ncbi:short-chain dehydrogenase [Veronia nyctiphanis]|uniref:Short-chain dehydrogenase n=1 Tax=Veronia nyctiphanis TaxID=1278244 RepID=A0A4Q0YJE2_9GAMM|nr:SDR family NAD(P)-dependent oxidoreductase [Veronia nyctiphanis]RXJ70827.1 short-chain dehydrogenase [Veronia nyctiphanis]